MNQSPKAPIWEVTYADDYDELTGIVFMYIGNIMKVNADFLSVLQQHESIIIEGSDRIN